MSLKLNDIMEFLSLVDEKNRLEYSTEVQSFIRIHSDGSGRVACSADGFYEIKIFQFCSISDLISKMKDRTAKYEKEEKEFTVDDFLEGLSDVEKIDLVKKIMEDL